MSEPVDDELFGQLNRALLEWKVIFFRGQDITSEQHAEFAAHWGPLESHPFIKQLVTQPDRVDVVRLEKGPKNQGTENVWHSDVTWRECPSLGSVLRAIDVPDLGGDTLWADMAAAYDGLTPEMQRHLEEMTAIHDWVPTFGRAMDDSTRAALRADFPAVEHPVVRTHPETGRKTLYVNRAFTQHIVGLDPDASQELLQFLYAQAAFPEYQCRFRWQPGGCGVLGQPLVTALRQFRLPPGSASDGAHHRDRRPPTLTDEQRVMGGRVGGRGTVPPWLRSRTRSIADGRDSTKACFERAGGRIAGKAFGMPVLVLTTTGRKSGEPRSTMLTSPVQDGAAYVLVASYGGDDRDPQWYRNLVANPQATIQLAGSTLDVWWLVPQRRTRSRCYGRRSWPRTRGTRDIRPRPTATSRW